MMNKRMSPAMDSRNQGYNKLELGFGLNFVNQKEFIKNNRFAIEFTFPSTKICGVFKCQTV